MANLSPACAMRCCARCACGQGDYTLMYGAVGTRVVLVASEPITRSAGDWVAVPRNTVLIVSHDKGGCLNVLSSPLGVADSVRRDTGSTFGCYVLHDLSLRRFGRIMEVHNGCRVAAKRSHAASRQPRARLRSPAAPGRSSGRRATTLVWLALAHHRRAYGICHELPQTW